MDPMVERTSGSLMAILWPQSETDFHLTRGYSPRIDQQATSLLSASGGRFQLTVDACCFDVQHRTILRISNPIASRMKIQVQTLLLVLVFVTLSAAPSDQDTIHQDGPQKQRLSVRQSEDKQPKVGKKAAEDYINNEIDDRIQLHEPFKSMLQTTARFALAQTQLPNHVNIDTAMSLINKAGFMLAKPSNLAKAIRMIGSVLAIFLATSFFFPGANEFVANAWRNPAHTFNLDRYLTNGISENSVFAAINSKTDETMNRIGLQRHSCREQSLCYTGEILKCTFPKTSELVTKFAKDNFSNTGFSENRYASAFLSGFVNENCTKFNSIEMRNEGGNCLGDFISTVISGRKDRQ